MLGRLERESARRQEEIIEPQTTGQRGRHGLGPPPPHGQPQNQQNEAQPNGGVIDVAQVRGAHNYARCSAGGDTAAENPDGEPSFSFENNLYPAYLDRKQSTMLDRSFRSRNATAFRLLSSV